MTSLPEDIWDCAFIKNLHIDKTNITKCPEKKTISDIKLIINPTIPIPENIKNLVILNEKDLDLNLDNFPIELEKLKILSYDSKIYLPNLPSNLQKLCIYHRCPKNIKKYINEGKIKLPFGIKFVIKDSYSYYNNK
jgi:hypothetical protein